MKSTQHSQREDSARQQLEQLQLILDAAKTGLWQWDIKSGQITWSAGLEKIHGLQPGTFAGTFEAYQNDIHPDDRERVLSAIRATLEQGPRHHLEYRLVWPDNSIHWVEARGELFRNAQGEAERMVGICSEITAEKETEQKLADEVRVSATLNRLGQVLAAELELQKLLQLITDEATALTDAQVGAFFYNVPSEQGESYKLYTLSGLSCEAIAPLPSPCNTALFEPTYRGTGIVRLDDVTQDPRYGQTPPHYGLPKGHPPVRSYLAVPVKARSGEVLGALFFGHAEAGVFDERDEQLLAGVAAQASVAIANARLYEQVRQSERRFRRLADAVPAMIWICRPDGYVSYINERWIEYTGQSADGYQGYGWAETVHPDDRAQLLAQWERCRHSGERYEGEVRYRRHDGQYRWHYFRGVPVRGDDGTVSAWYGTSLDIEEKKTAEQALAAANRRKDEFLAMLSHELRNPLAAINNGLHLLEQSGARERQDWARMMMQRQAAHLARLLDDLLDVSRITRGRIELRKEPLALSELVEQALSDVRELIDEHRHRLHLRLSEEPLVLYADPTRLIQIISNLLTNAAKYCEPGADIELTTLRDGDAAVIKVSDSGIGIAPQRLEDIFELFAQVDAALDRSQGGLGLGLTLVRQLTELHGGTVSAASPGPGQGSTFTVRLPLAPASVLAPGPTEAAEAPGAATESSAAQRLRVLVVDDNTDAVRAMAMLLEYQGYQVTTAFDGETALICARAQRPHAVLLDIGLPGLDGYQVAERLRSDPEFADLFIVAISGYGQPDDRRRSRAAGFDHHLLKPVDMAGLQELLEARFFSSSADR